MFINTKIHSNSFKWNIPRKVRIAVPKKGFCVAVLATMTLSLTRSMSYKFANDWQGLVCGRPHSGDKTLLLCLG